MVVDMNDNQNDKKTNQFVEKYQQALAKQDNTVDKPHKDLNSRMFDNVDVKSRISALEGKEMPEPAQEPKMSESIVSEMASSIEKTGKMEHSFADGMRKQGTTFKEKLEEQKLNNDKNPGIGM